jgi:hypothetical protein
VVNLPYEAGVKQLFYFFMDEVLLFNRLLLGLLLDRSDIGVDLHMVLNHLPRDPRHLQQLPAKHIDISPKEGDEQKFSSVLNVTGRDIHPRSITNMGPTPENERDGSSFDIGICSFLKATWLMRFSDAPPLIRTWYNLMFVMARDMSSGSCPVPAMLLGQSNESKLIGVSIHLWCGAALGAGTATAFSWRSVLPMRQDVMP